jgi:hypothetical protein
MRGGCGVRCQTLARGTIPQASATALLGDLSTPTLLTLLLLWPLVGRGLTILHLIGLKDALFCE